MTIINQFPHCDSRVLHAPGECKYCDKHTDWQELRRAWGINFTGHTTNQDNDPHWRLMPCPSDFNRGVAGAHVWPGNRPTEDMQSQKTIPVTLYERFWGFCEENLINGALRIDDNWRVDDVAVKFGETILHEFQQLAIKIEGDPMLSTRTTMTRNQAAQRITELVAVLKGNGG